MKLFISITLILFCCCGMKGQQTAGNSWQMDAQSEIIGVCVKKGGTESGVNVTSRFPMYSVMKFPQALYVADYLTKNNIELNTKVTVRKHELMQDTWSPMLNTFEGQRTFTYSELLALSLQQSDNNACDILFKLCGSPWKVEKYIRDLGFKDIRIQKTEKQMHAKPVLSNKNWCTPLSMVERITTTTKLSAISGN